MKIIFCNLCNPPASSQASCKLVILLKPSTLPKTSGCFIFFSCPNFLVKTFVTNFCEKKKFFFFDFLFCKMKVVNFFSFLSVCVKENENLLMFERNFFSVKEISHHFQQNFEISCYGVLSFPKMFTQSFSYRRSLKTWCK